MKLLFESWKKFLNEDLNHYRMEIQIKTEPETLIYGSIFNKIRAIEGVTIIKSTGKMFTDGYKNKYLHLSIKFIANPRMDQATFLDLFKSKVKTLRDEQGDRILSVKILKLPKKYK